MKIKIFFKIFSPQKILADCLATSLIVIDGQKIIAIM